MTALIRLVVMLAVGLTPLPAVASLSTVYLAQAAAGLDDGTSCANAHAVTFFNTAGNWGAGAAQIGAGTTVHLCGTFTGGAGATMLTTQGAGSVGNPVTIVFETGAVFTAPYWSNNGAIIINHSDIRLDGGTNGLITATANGTALANQQFSDAVNVGNSGNPARVEVRNLRVTNLCVRQANSSNTTCNGIGVRVNSSGGGLRIHHNSFTSLGAAVFIQVNITQSDDQVYNNTMQDLNGGIGHATCGNGITVSGLVLRDNEIFNMANWDDPADFFHHDSVHTFNCGGTLGVLSAPQIYNNYIHGSFGSHSTAGLFLEDSWSGALLFNNLFTSASGAPTNGLIALKGGLGGGAGTGASVYHNTFAPTTGGPCVGMSGSIGNTVENNIFSGCGTAINVQDITSRTGFVSDFNDFFSVIQWAWPGIISSFGSWQSTTGQDGNSSTANPLLDGTAHLLAGSAALSLGINLSGLGIAALSTSKPSVVGVAGLSDGIARSAVDAWDAGAYEFAAPAVGASGGRLPMPPTQLRLLRRVR